MWLTKPDEEKEGLRERRTAVTTSKAVNRGVKKRMKKKKPPARVLTYSPQGCRLVRRGRVSGENKIDEGGCWSTGICCTVDAKTREGRRKARKSDATEGNTTTRGEREATQGMNQEQAKTDTC